MRYAQRLWGANEGTLTFDLVVLRIYCLTHRKGNRHIRVGRSLRPDPSEIEEWLVAHRRPQKTVRSGHDSSSLLAPLKGRRAISISRLPALP